MIPHSPLWMSADVISALTLKNRKGSEEWSAGGVSIDTRTLEPGDIFFAVSGPNFDAHDFVADAFAKGAVAAVVTREPIECPGEAPLLFVEDTVEALQQLGMAARNRLEGKVIAVTGSVGKTGTKEMLRLGLGVLGSTAASAGNLNNHLGLPLSLSRVPPKMDFTVLEIGMNHAGEIRSLVKIARPHVAIITAIEPAHTEFFSSVEEIADAKAEIFEGVEPGGTAVINRDSPYYERLSTAAGNVGIDIIVGFGSDAAAEIKLVDSDLSANGSSVVTTLHGREIRYRIGAPGRHVVMNSLAVIASIDAAGGDVARAVQAFEDFAPLKGRGQHLNVQLSQGPFLLVDESYNASPASMRAALAVGGKLQPGPGGRRIAVLGDMLELGKSASHEHASLLEPLQENAFDIVFTSGQHSQSLWDVLPESMRGGHSISPDKLAMVVSSAVRAGDVVMVKGSLGSRVGLIVEALLSLDQSQVTDGPAVVNGN